ncbi:MAG: Gldg family protein [Planctomycetes bacterium]|nr:Gldg family protein [Planctomycetota bacterium]
MNPKRNLWKGLLVCLVLFFSINLASSTLFRKARLDLTESGLFTLSDGTRAILEGMEDDVTLRFYFSKSMANDLTDLRDYARRVEELLVEYQSIAGPRLDVQIIEPEPFSEEEDQAVGFGIQGVPVNNAGEMLYFGLVGTNTIDGEELIPFFQLRREEFLEYDLTKLIYRLANPDRTTVGLLTTLPLGGGPANPMQPQAAPQPWFIVETIEQTCDLEMISPTATEIPAEVDVLLVVHPKEFSDELLYSIDQFVLKGGRAVLYLDPHCEQDIPPQDPSNPMAAMTANRTSDLGPLLDAWGVNFPTEKVVADRLNALPVMWQNQRTDFVVFLGLDAEACDSEDPVTAELNQLRVGIGGHFLSAEGATTTLTPLIQTSEEAMLVDKMNVSFGPDPARLIREYIPGGERLTLAARLTGDVKSAYPGGLPQDPESEGVDPTEKPLHVEDSTEPIQIVLIADADLLQDRWWVQVSNFFGMRIAQPQANNGDMLVNAIDNLSGSSDLISLRSRGSFHRPFGYLDEIRRNADQQARDQEAALQAKLEETERKIQELQQQKDGGVSSVILSSEQRAEIEQFRSEQVETRKELRAVQHSLAKKIEDVGALVKAANVFGLPAVILLIGLITAASRGGRKRS